ncbi:unnamed protein product [Prunus armeniaca]|uniref:adenylate dimethylallyltransferase (ADP/ATP-dependent) n=2 Tax=Prunus armeniaca TaxID=36596 RepID=A0A6J5YBY4_PRUAR|nr:unnamed protein product [Prunus armeniaca]
MNLMCKEMQTLLPSGAYSHKMDVFNPRRQKEKVVIVMGATGTGKSRLSIDLATHLAAEIINSDKMQVYKGLDIATNKITEEEQRGVPHHLLGIHDPNADFTAADFCDETSLTIESILGRDRLPIIVGGSNSYIEALIDDYDYKFRSKYECCFLWVNVSTPVLHSFVSKRVDKMVENGMVDEVKEFFHPNADYSKGIRRAIGVPEFDKYFRYGPFLDEETKARLLEQAVEEIKKNNCKLASRQLEKIQRLRNVKGWNLHPLDATEVFRKRGKESDEAWEKFVYEPSAQIVRQFLYNYAKVEVPVNLGAMRVPMESAALAAATH